MGRRSQPRKQVEVPVRIFGTDSAGQVFSEKVLTVSISRNGAELAAVRSKLNLDEIVGLTYGANRVHFRVKWIGSAGTPQAGHVGLLNIAPRFRCQNSVEVHVQGASFWGTVADLSLGGCYIEMPIPLQPGTKLRVGIWFGQTKSWADAQVAHRTPGLGIGLKFVQISEEDRNQIRRFLESLAPFARKPMRSLRSRT